MEILKESIWDKFLHAKPIVKDIGAIRAKGIILEDALELLKDNMNQFTLVSRYDHPDSACVGYHEVYYDAVLVIGDQVIEAGVAWAAARMGIPSLAISVNSQRDWLLIRSELQAKGFVRTYERNPVHKKDGKWYFWADKCGPFTTKTQAKVACNNYAKDVLEM